MKLNAQAFARKGFPASFGSFSNASSSSPYSNNGGRRRKQQQESLSEDEEESSRVELLKRILSMDDEDDTILESPQPKMKTKKGRKYRAGGVRLMDSNRNEGYRRMHPTESTWYMIYVMHPRIDCTRFLQEFRRRFRVPHQYFLDLSNELEGCAAFKRWHKGARDRCGVTATPISLLLLTALRYIGRAWTIDDLNEATGVSQEVIRNFIHIFLEYGATVLYRRYVITPSCSKEAKTHMGEYRLAGFPGAVGSSDATHVVIERVQFKHRQSHLGFKMSHTARTYNITVNHRRRILSTTRGHPARWNDKTVCLFDPFMRKLHSGDILDDNIFDLYAYNGTGQIVKQRYRGCWLLVDNGYLARPTTVPPIKWTTSRMEIRFSAWLESLRKDVECTFGILKGRWRILKSGIRLFGTVVPDNVFLTCCALHNCLLEIDGLDQQWEDGIDCDWVVEPDRQGDDEDAESVFDDDQAGAESDNSSRNCGSQSHSAEVEEENKNDRNDDGDHAAFATSISSGGPVELVRNLSLDEFRKRLVVHFAIAYSRDEVKWPSRLGDKAKTPAADFVDKQE